MWDKDVSKSLRESNRVLLRIEKAIEDLKFVSLRKTYFVEGNLNGVPQAGALMFLG